MRKKLVILTIVFLMLANVMVFADGKDHLWTWKDKEIGAYVNVGGITSGIFSGTSGFMNSRAGLVFNDKWGIGITGSALFHDNKLEKLVDDGTYHLSLSYGGMFLERIFSVTDNFKISGMIMSGQGEAFYQYDHKYRKEKIWTEEIIDRTTFGVQELSLQLQHRIYNNLWLAFNANLRNTSPIELLGLQDNILKESSFGFNISYGIY